MSDTASGLLLCLTAGATSGSFALPMRFARGWAWENIWFVWTILALLVIPATMTVITIPRGYELYAESGAGFVVTVATLGVAWGLAQVLFGLAVETIGMALAFSIVSAMSAAIGSAVPLFGARLADVLSARGAMTLAGIALIVSGMATCALAGRRREAAQPASDGGSVRRYRGGLALAFGSGFGAAMINLGLVFGAPLLERASQIGVDPLWSANTIWLPLMMAGALPNVAYCIHLMRRNRTGARFVAPRTRANWLHAAVMATFWFGGITLYGVASRKLGSWGVILGWPLFTSLIVVTAGALGFAFGEWTAAQAGVRRVQICGMAVLVLAVFVLSAASQLG